MNICQTYCYGPGFVQLHLEKAISIQTSGQECKVGENSWEGWLSKLGPGLKGSDPEICREPRRSPGEGNGNPFQYFCLENPMDRGAWWATVHKLTESEATQGLSHHSKDTISQLSHICRYWGVRTSMYLFGGYISTSNTSHLLSLTYLQTMQFIVTEMFSMPDHVPPLFKPSVENTFAMKKEKKKKSKF